MQHLDWMPEEFNWRLNAIYPRYESKSLIRKFFGREFLELSEASEIPRTSSRLEKARKREELMEGEVMRQAHLLRERRWKHEDSSTILGSV